MYRLQSFTGEELLLLAVLSPANCGQIDQKLVRRARFGGVPAPVRPMPTRTQRQVRPTAVLAA